MSEFFVLFCLIPLCLRSFLAPLLGMNQPPAPAQRTPSVTKQVTGAQMHPLAPFPAPTLRLMV
ncbi:MAG: hypothetical protein RLZZ591_478 [Pseudomonadota bacterium]|jgi:hypothetical protein